MKHLLITLLVFSAYSHADLTNELSQKLSNTECFSAGFTQTLVDESLHVLQESSGTINAMQPNKMRWEITSPDTQLIISDGIQLWRYEEDLEQVIISNFNEGGAGLPAKILSGNIEALSQYDVSYVNDSYELRPKNDGDLFKTLLIQFSSGALTTLKMQDSFLQWTTINFSPLQEPCDNTDLYAFIPPEDIDIIYE